MVLMSFTIHSSWPESGSIKGNIAIPCIEVVVTISSSNKFS